jgi:HK97 family phage portal protein
MWRVLENILGRQSLERPTTPLSGAALLSAFGAIPSASGRYVSPKNALRIATVYACVRVIAETIATLPLHVYRELPGGGSERVFDHSVAVCFGRKGPNREMSRVDYFEALVGHVLLWGNGYSSVQRSLVDGRITSLSLLRPDRTTLVRNSRGVLVYQTVDELGQPTLRRYDRVLHVRTLSDDGLTGYSPIALARETLGMAAATADYGARFFANDSRPGGVLATDGQLSSDAIDRLRASWEAAHSAVAGNSHKVAVLENGLKWQSIGMPNDDAQWLETRKYTRSEIAGLFRVPAHLINDLDKATFSNIEQLGLEFSTLCIGPWCARIEAEINQTLFTEAEQETLYVKFNMGGLIRGDIASRFQAYATARQNGWMTANEIRELEELNPVEGGDELLVNGNRIPIQEAGAAAAAATPGG